MKDSADRSCFFQVLSRFKVRKMNDQVREGDMIYLLNLDADGHYLAATPQTFDRAHTFGTDGEHEHVRNRRYFGPFLQSLYTDLHTPCDVVYFVPMLAGC